MDRLSALIARFAITVTIAPPGTGNLVVLSRVPHNAPHRIAFCPRGCATSPASGETVLIEALADLGGPRSPLMTALPDRVSLTVEEGDEADLLLRLLLAEASAKRCGAGTVLSRLAEVLIIRLLRGQIEQGTATRGLFAGLADPRLSRAIVAIHENPGRDWNNDEMADIAGLSISRFAELFQRVLDATPQTYLRQWRMTLARQDVERGDRIKSVATRYGYGSSEAFSKAFGKQFGYGPLELRGRSRMRAD